jgi:eukaryotic-like serine/threonine-protein kinase
LHGLAKAEMAMARPADAIPLLERALTLTQSLQWRPSFQAHAKLTLARALWDAARDRGRAVALAREAESIYAGLGPRAAKDRDVAAAWLRTRR